MGKRRSAFRAVAGKPEEKKTLGRSRRIWENNIKMDLKIIGLVVWAGLIWFRIGARDGLL
jgi:hypothetical protein